MSNCTLKNINNIPARTWRWLGVNNISLTGELPQVKKYDLKGIEEYSGSDYKIAFMNKSLNALDEIDSLKWSGIDGKLTDDVKNNFNTGVFIKSYADKKNSVPILIDYNMDGEEKAVLDNNIIVAEENSELTVVMKYSSKEGTKAFHNGLTRFYAKKGSTINIIKIQTLSNESMHFDSNISKVEDNAVINYTEVDLGGHYSITNYTNDLKGYKSSENIYSIYLGDKDRIIDINYLINHYGKVSKSSIKARGALLDKSSKIFRGTIDFKKGCAKSKGAEEEYVILLSPDVRNRSVPILLCTEEDVDGQHAASSGRTDADKLFYLMCRGLSEKEAKRLIIEASFNPIIDKIPIDSIKSEISDCIRRKFNND